MVYFGTKGNMGWVKDPSVDFNASRVGWTAQVNFLNGGAAIRSSTSSHAEVDLSWSLMSNSQANDILMPLRSGEPVYWVDPFAENVMPQAWAEPWRATVDGPILDGSNVRPTVTTLVTSNRYPAKAARYVLTAATAATRRKVWLPIPPGYNLHLGVKGAVVAGTPVVKVTYDSGTSFNATLTTAGGAKYSHVISGNTHTGVTIELSGNGTIDLQAIVAHVALIGSQPPATGFSPGEGMGGCLPAGEPSETRYSAVLPNANRGIAVKLVEVEPWR